MKVSVSTDEEGKGTDSNSELRSVKDKRRPASVVVKRRGK
jgi:hypothetical protein